MLLLLIFLIVILAFACGGDFGLLAQEIGAVLLVGLIVLFIVVLRDRRELKKYYDAHPDRRNPPPDD